jgi:hypothetical protein
MSAGFGYDFSGVRIHTDAKAQEMSEKLGAQAFTYKGEVFFNKQKFDPQSKEGKWLLAHELTHVIQQKEGNESINKKDIPAISTPVPDDFSIRKNKEVVTSAVGTINGVKLIIRPDTRGEVSPGASAETAVDLKYALPGMSHEKGKVVKIEGVATVTITIHTQYLPGVKKTAASAYGKGTTSADKTAGNTSLQFHEASHGIHVMNFLKQNPVPAFEGRTGMTVADFNKAKESFIKKILAYRVSMMQANKQEVDCVGTPSSSCKP